jgi:ankyrin repeat protein
VLGGITPLHDAAVGGNPAVVELLIAHGAGVDAKTESERTPLHYAAGYRRTRGAEGSFLQQLSLRGGRQQSDVIRLLLAKGADVHAKDKDAATPLRYALQSGQRDSAEILIAAGAEKVAVKNEGNQRMLHYAFRQKDLALVRLLLANGADTEEQDENGNTLLHLAARDPNQEVAELLIAHHANANAQNQRGMTPLCYAAAGGATDLTSLLLANSADVNAKDKGGDTALHGAALRGHREVVQLLLARGADVTVKNSRGHTPLDEASRRGHADIVRLLTTKAKGPSASVQDEGIKK